MASELVEKIEHFTRVYQPKLADIAAGLKAAQKLENQFTRDNFPKGLKGGFSYCFGKIAQLLFPDYLIPELKILFSKSDIAEKYPLTDYQLSSYDVLVYTSNPIARQGIIPDAVLRKSGKDLKRSIALSDEIMRFVKIIGDFRSQDIAMDNADLPAMGIEQTICCRYSKTHSTEERTETKVYRSQLYDIKGFPDFINGFIVRMRPSITKLVEGQKAGSLKPEESRALGWIVKLGAVSEDLRTSGLLGEIQALIAAEFEQKLAKHRTPGPTAEQREEAAMTRFRDMVTGKREVLGGKAHGH